MIDWANIGKSGPVDSVEIRVNVPTFDTLLADAERLLLKQQGFTIATLNLDHVVKLGRHERFRQAYSNHSHVTADGRPVVWFSRLAGDSVSLVPGSDLVLPFSRIAARLGVPVALVGSVDDSLARAARAISTEVPGLNIVACISPPMGFDPDEPTADELIQELHATGARLVFLALGAPKQEIFATRAAETLPDVGFLSIGAGLDFLSGAQARAPKLARAMALEWLWRLASNPRRLGRRYLACIAILPAVTRAALHNRRVNS